MHHDDLHNGNMCWNVSVYIDREIRCTLPSFYYIEIKIEIDSPYLYTIKIYIANLNLLQDDIHGVSARRIGEGF